MRTDRGVVEAEKYAVQAGEEVRSLAPVGVQLDAPQLRWPRQCRVRAAPQSSLSCHHRATGAV